MYKLPGDHQHQFPLRDRETESYIGHLHKIQHHDNCTARFIHEEVIESLGYRLYKGQPSQRVMKNVPHLEQPSLSITK